MTTVEPVEDWAEDFELFDPEYVNDPAPFWKELRETHFVWCDHPVITRWRIARWGSAC